jgi:hypothetical protein
LILVPTSLLVCGWLEGWIWCLLMVVSLLECICVLCALFYPVTVFILHITRFVFIHFFVSKWDCLGVRIYIYLLLLYFCYIFELVYWCYIGQVWNIKVLFICVLSYGGTYGIVSSFAMRCRESADFLLFLGPHCCARFYGVGI